MEITIKGDAKEIAALVLAVQERRDDADVGRVIDEIARSTRAALGQSFCDSPPKLQA